MLKKNLKSIVRFQDPDKRDSFFDAILYGLLFNFSEKSKVVETEKSTEVLGEEFYNKLISKKNHLQLDDSFESFLTSVILLTIC